VEYEQDQPDIEPDQSGSAFMHPQTTHAVQDRDVFGNAPKYHHDWSHRRGEPRVFTLLWMVYLMGSTLLMFASMASAQSISPDITRPAARTMLIVVVIGFSVLWPMVRFSQKPHTDGYTHFAIRDAIVIFVPMQAVIWPQALPVLAGWPITVVAAVSAMSLAWLTVLAGVVGIGSSSIARNLHKEWVRVVWMLIVIGIVFAAPIIGGVWMLGASLDVAHPRVGWLLSPVTALLEIVRDRRELGTSAKVFEEHWRMIIALLCVGTALLLIARAIEVARSKYGA
jgi:hypothetical protein